MGAEGDPVNEHAQVVTREGFSDPLNLFTRPVSSDGRSPRASSQRSPTATQPPAFAPRTHGSPNRTVPRRAGRPPNEAPALAGKTGRNGRGRVWAQCRRAGVRRTGPGTGGAGWAQARPGRAWPDGRSLSATW